MGVTRVPAAVNGLSIEKVFMVSCGEPHHTHQTIEQAVEMARRVNAEHTYFIHMCHQAGRQGEADRQLPEGMRFAYDGLDIEC